MPGRPPLPQPLCGIAVAALGLILVAMSGCASADDPTPVDATELFARDSIGGLAGCSTCHTLTPDRTPIGPSLAGMASRAEARVDGLNAEEYLTESILHPDAFYVAGFGAGMPAFGEALTASEINALVDYLLTIE